ncbi:MAG: hypothetical protein V1875_01725 [Candidatus Altiarchaeota archaeon]
MMALTQAELDLHESIAEVLHSVDASFNTVTLKKFFDYRGVETISELSEEQKVELVEALIIRCIQHGASQGKASIIRVEVFSLLGIKRLPIKKEEELKAKNIDDFKELWRMTHDYIPSPNKRLLEEDMKLEFKNMIHVFLDKIKGKTDAEAPKKMVKGMFGEIASRALAFSKDRGHKNSEGWVVQKSLSTYINEYDSREMTHEVLGTAKNNASQDLKQINWGVEFEEENKVADEVREYVRDMNQVILRMIENLSGADMLDKKEAKLKVLTGLMSYYFGAMSEKYLEREYAKLNISPSDTTKTEQKIKLIMAVIYDCLQTSLGKDGGDAVSATISKSLKLEE